MIKEIKNKKKNEEQKSISVLPTENGVAVEIDGDEETQDVMNNNPTSIAYKPYLLEHMSSDKDMEIISNKSPASISDELCTSEPSINVKKEPVEISTSRFTENCDEVTEDILKNNPALIINESYVFEPLITNLPNENGVAVQPSINVKKEPVDICSSPSTENCDEEMQDISKNRPTSSADESYVLEPRLEHFSAVNITEHIGCDGVETKHNVSNNITESLADSISMEQEEDDSTFFVDPRTSILHSTARHSMLPHHSDLDDSNWTDYESDVKNVTYNESYN